VGVGTAEAEGTDAGDAFVAIPGLGLLGQVEAGALDVQFRFRFLETGHGGDDLVVNSHGGANHTGNARSTHGVADVGFGRADCGCCDVAT
jgi:hypothetical protein